MRKAVVEARPRDEARDEDRDEARDEARVNSGSLYVFRVGASGSAAIYKSMYSSALPSLLLMSYLPAVLYLCRDPGVKQGMGIGLMQWNY